jgi:hypothetical protein
MATKLGKSAYPTGHGPNDFTAFGPPATKDGEFVGTMICDCGCFNQQMVDSNKYYCAMVTQSKINQKWYAYFEWGRQGASNPQFQFVECSFKDEAQQEYEKQLHSKNDKRGEWITHATLGRILQAKAGKDCYLVRPQATRSTGLPDARTIKHNESVAAIPLQTKKLVVDTKKKKPAITCDSQTLKLMKDINVATVAYTRGAMSNDSLPTLEAINEGRDILDAAMLRLKTVGDNLDHQIKDKEIIMLTNTMYGRIPKKKERNAAADTWILSKNNISLWQQDLDAFESALSTVAADADVDDQHDPFGGMRLKMEWLSPQSGLGEFVSNWLPRATRNKHGYLGAMKVKNAWSVEREGDAARLSRAQARIGKVTTKERPFHQPTTRHDLNKDEAKLFADTHTAMLIHGTRSVNLRGILEKGLLMPRQLVGVTITGAMFGPLLYWADDWKKSAGYTSLSGGYYSSGSGGIKGRGAFMFIGDVVLGVPHVAPHAYGYTQCPAGTHSIFGKAGHSGVQNNEWLIANADQNRLRYLVEFDVA